MTCPLGRTYSDSHATCQSCQKQQAMACNWVVAESKPSKHRNQKVKTEEGTFDSKKEYGRYCQLKMMQAAGKIQELKRQVPFILVPGVMIHGRKKPDAKYFADFVYQENGQLVIEDTKSPITRQDPVYRLKIHLLKHVFGYEVIEV